jgi:hypothetical protein
MTGLAIVLQCLVATGVARASESRWITRPDAPTSVPAQNEIVAEPAEPKDGWLRVRQGMVIGPSQTIYAGPDSSAVARDLVNGSFIHIDPGDKRVGDARPLLITSAAGRVWVSDHQFTLHDLADFVSTLAVNAKEHDPKVVDDIFSADGWQEMGDDLPRRYLGVYLYSATGSSPRYIVRYIVPGSPAERAQLQAGDVLQEVGGAKIAGPRSEGDDLVERYRIPELEKELDGHAETVRVAVRRGGKRVEVKCKPVPREEAAGKLVINHLGRGNYALYYLVY